MAGLAYAMINSLSLNNVNLFTGTGDITMAAEGCVVVKKASGAATQVTLPPHPADNLGGTFRWVIDGKGDAATNNITVVAASGNIQGAANYVISENYGAVCLFYPNGGTEWLVVSAANPLSSTELAFLNGVTAGTAAASKAVVLGANGEIASIGAATFNSTLTLSDVASINAAGTVIGNATAISHTISVVAGADDAKGVVLPTAVAGKIYAVYSSQATNGLKVYPPVNGTINDGSANAAIVIEGKSLALFFGTSATNYAAMFTVNS